ncbi:MAG: type IIA DNA topoisomerase subunit B [Bacteroidales bacterium]|nr:type IIA DNA topoisomerase subunit B [Candidatus Egerieousia equi]
MAENLVNNYTEDDFQTLSWNEHIRRRPGMYLGKLGDGSNPDDGIYILFKEIIDNAIDEFGMGFGKRIDITLEDRLVSVRDYGRGIPFGKLVESASAMNTGAKYGSAAFKKSVGLNGVGTKAVNATSTYYYVQSFRDGKSVYAEFSKGNLVRSGEEDASGQKNGTLVKYIADDSLYENYSYNMEFLNTMLRNYAYLNRGLVLMFNGQEFVSKNGLLDLINDNLTEEPLYPVIHLMGEDIEVAITHGTDNGENIASFVNGQNTIHGGTHLAAFREGVAKTVKDFFKKDFDPKDVRQSIVAAVSIRVEEPSFSNQTKTFLNSRLVAPGKEITIRNFIVDFLQSQLDNYLHKNSAAADRMLKKILESEKERKAISGLQKIAREKAKKASLHNRKLRDCRIHYGDKDPLNDRTMLFITEGDSASGSITKSRDANYQAVFSLRGKPLNTFDLAKDKVYANDEFALLQAALNIEDDIDNLRYNKVVIATDADVDGMHIRLLLLTYFLQFSPEIIRQGHLYILQTPLFRVRKKMAKGNMETCYCYSGEEREKALKKFGKTAEITRFKGLGEISPDEFADFIGDGIRLDRVRLSPDDSVSDLLEFYMGKNTFERQNFIRENLRSELIVEETLENQNIQ